MLLAILYTLSLIPYTVAARPIIDDEYGKTPPYEMIYHWSHLDWNFKDSLMKQQFEANQSWKHSMPAGIKVDTGSGKKSPMNLQRPALRSL